VKVRAGNRPDTPSHQTTRNVETNDQLELAGMEVVRIAGSEPGPGCGGPRCMSCPISQDAMT
jgi:arginine deiminase